VLPLLRVVVGLDAKTAAQVLGKRPGAVRTAAYRGLTHLAERLDNKHRRRVSLPRSRRALGEQAGWARIADSPVSLAYFRRIPWCRTKTPAPTRDAVGRSGDRSVTLNVEGRTNADVRDPAPLLWGAAAACWTATLMLSAFGDGHDHAARHGSLPGAAQVGGFLLTWTVMVGAMMLPTTVPMSRMIVVASARAPHPGRTRAVFAVSYLVVWLGFGLVGLSADLGRRAAVQRWVWLDGDSRLMLGAMVAGVGAFQFSRLKDRCLTACRDPKSIPWHRGPRGAGMWRAGRHHALNCLGCCWALMLVMFAAGVTNLVVMLLLTAVMAAETTTRWGKRLVTPVGAALLVAAAAVVLSA
jgi:predicted metal-binding membrane protein